MSPRGAPPGGGRSPGLAEEPSDRALMAAHVAGDPDAFGTLVRRHTGRLWAVALRTLRDPDEAADALQDALVSAFRGAAAYRGDSEVTTWLHRVVVNACLDRIRRAKARPSVPLPEHDLAQRGDAHDSLVTRLDVRSALTRLPEAQRLAIVLVDLHGLSVAEAAQVLEVAPGTVKSRCARGRATLAVLLRPDGEDGRNPDPPPHVPSAHVAPPHVPGQPQPAQPEHRSAVPAATTPTEEQA